MKRNLERSLRFTASKSALYVRVGSSKTFASLPSLHGLGECASELDMRPTLSSVDSLQFIAGSELSPVSRAKIFPA